jgi:RNA polymerase sigma-70 factor (sigma-E family)
VDRDSEFSEFASARWLRLVRSARLLGCSVHEAEDVAQTTLLKCYLAWSKVSRADNPDAYVARVLINAHRQSRRRMWWRELPTEHLPEPEATDATAAMADADAVRHALDRLPPAQREVVVLRHYLGLSEREAADSLGVPSGTVKSRLSRAIAQLAASDDLRSILDGRTT